MLTVPRDVSKYILLLSWVHRVDFTQLSKISSQSGFITIVISATSDPRRRSALNLYLFLDRDFSMLKSNETCWGRR